MFKVAEWPMEARATTDGAELGVKTEVPPLAVLNNKAMVQAGSKKRHGKAPVPGRIHGLRLRLA